MAMSLSPAGSAAILGTQVAELCRRFGKVYGAAGAPAATTAAGALVNITGSLVHDSYPLEVCK